MKEQRLKFTDPRGPYGLSPWWWIVFCFFLLVVIGIIGTRIAAL